MAICAYCGKSAVLTREHVIPKWFYDLNRSPEDVSFLEKAKKRFLQTDLVVRDVCKDCNGGPLSDLDAYAKQFYSAFLSMPVFGGSTPTIRYDFQRLAKWLLKVAFNSARVHATDLEILGAYTKFMIDDGPLPASLRVYVSSVAPSVASADGAPSIASSGGHQRIHYPEWFRVGVFRVPAFDSIDWAYRHVSINAYCFHLLVPRLGVDSSVLRELELFTAVRDAERYGIELGVEGQCVVPSPRIDALSYSLAHIGAFALTYEVIQNDVLRKAVEGEFDVVQYWIDREDIESKSETHVLSFLADISVCREVALGLRGKIEFVVHGYDEDPRELYEIPEVVAFLSSIDRQWPYWMLFQFPHGHWLQVLAACLSEAVRVPDGNFELNMRLLRANIDRWFEGLNELSHRFAITTSVNRDVSEAAICLLKGMLKPTA